MTALLSDADLNDFISPGLACIKPAGEVRTKEQKSDGFEVSIDDGTTGGLKEANISLQDCLACSGCITSAEEVLLAKQTHKILLEDLNKYSEQKIFVFSISHQSRVSLSAFWKIPTHKVDEVLINMFSEKFGFRFAVGTELARLMSIARINAELIQKKQSQESQVQLSSICPGFVLYVEKTKPEILPYLLNVKSPQQLTGFVLKSLISKQMNIAYSDIYHLSIMPCFDKKLEAARPEELVDVDCVLTPKEVAELVKEEQVDIRDYMTPQDQLPTDLYTRAAPHYWPYPVESWSSNLGSASGGYAENYIIALQLHYAQQGIETRTKELRGKNSDVSEYQLLSLTGDKLGSSAIVNGFRNIQNLVRKIKPTGKVKIGSGLAARRKARKTGSTGDADTVEFADPSLCDFVEVMACPGGCINGGGVNNGGNTVDNKQLIAELTQLYQELPMVEKLNAQFIGQFVEEFQRMFEAVDDRMFRYKFSIIEQATDILSVGNKW